MKARYSFELRYLQRGQCLLTPVSGHRQAVSACPKSADSVEKVFLGCRTKILRAADAFYARRREGPYRFIQNRSRTSVVALKSDAAAERSKINFREFLGLFDFRLLQQYRHLADVGALADVRFAPQAAVPEPLIVRTLGRALQSDAGSHCRVA